MSSTSSEEKPDDMDSVQRDASDTEEEEQEDVRISHDEEPDRKRPRISPSERAREAERERERRMERYAKARIRELEPVKKNAEFAGKRPLSREPSRSRSDARSRSKSPAVGLPPARVGKRLRRRPQRWEGEKREVSRSSRPSAAPSPRVRESEVVPKEPVGEPTLSATSVPLEGECPVIDNPVNEMKKALEKSFSEGNRRAIVDSFHTWQLQSVSRQAAQQKTLQMFLKRKLRKRTQRCPEIERLEEEALRKSRTATLKTGNDDEEESKGKFTVEEDEAENVVPTMIRLPLEAYLPRRVKVNKVPLRPEDILSINRLKPKLPASVSEINETTSNGHEVWMRFPTVAAPSSLNKQKRSFQNGQTRGR